MDIMELWEIYCRKILVNIWVHFDNNFVHFDDRLSIWTTRRAQ